MRKKIGIILAVAFVLGIFATSAIGCESAKKWSKDEQVWGITGIGAGNILYASNWGGILTPATTLQNESTATANKFTITIDLWEGDMFKFITPAYAKELGYQDLATKDAAVFGSDDAGGMIADSLHKNIKVVKEGNYTFTVTTNPMVDADNKIAYVNNGKVVGEKVAAAKTVFIKGDGVSEWQNFYSPYHQFNALELNKKYEKTMWLDAKSIMLVSQNLTVTTGAVVINNAEAQYGKLAELSKDLVSNIGDSRMAGRNIDIKTAGNYKVTYEPEVKHTVKVVAVAGAEPVSAEVTGKVSLEKISDQAKIIAEDFYLDGEYAGKEWITANKNLDAGQKFAAVDGSTTKFMKEVTLKKDDQFNINSYAVGATSTGDKLANRKTIYNHDYVMDSLYFTDSTASRGGNIKVKKDNTYIITIDTYSKIIKILPKAAAGQENRTVIICGPAATGDWNTVLFDAAHTLTRTAGAQEYKLNIALTVNELNARGYDDGITFGNAPINIGKAQYDATGTAAANFDTTGNNIKCLTAGTYEVVITQVGTAWKIKFNTVA